jgi:hypothetical protein
VRAAIIAAAALLAGCDHHDKQPVSLAKRADDYIRTQLSEENASRAPLLLYAQALDTALTVRSDRNMDAAVYDSMLAESCVGLLPDNHAASDVRREVRAILTSTPERQAAFHRYLAQSTRIALGRDEQGHCELI